MKLGNRKSITNSLKICKGLLRNNEKDKVFKPHGHIPYGADGSGYYSDNMLCVYNVMRKVTPLVLDAALSTSIQPGSTFTIADYGCADGGTSMSLMYECIKALREKHGNENAIQIIYEDQPINDFKSLFMRLQGLIPGHRSYFLDFRNVFVNACGTNFYSQCLPNDSVTLGFSSMAMHWLREKPCDITGALHHMMITEEREKVKFREQAESDWETILLHRAAELKSGSKMVLVMFAVDDEGQYLGNTKNIKHSMHHLFRDLWLGLVEDGTITKEEFTSTNITNYYRTTEELKKPFQNPEDAVRKAGLELVSMETKISPCPFHDKWTKERGNAAAHAQWYMPTIRLWSNHSFRSALSNSRTDEEKDKIVDEFFKRYEAHVVQDPDNHAFEHVVCYMVVQKL